MTLDSSPAELRIESLSVRFGGVSAVNDVSLVAPPGRITGLIGPNGAGKTTTFNACTGLVRASAGTVRFAGHDLAGRSSARRAQLGLGRTFQRMELWDTMTVLENVALGLEARLAGQRPWGQLLSPGGQRREALVGASDALTRCGITELGDRLVGDLSTGERRLVELARATASRFRLLLLDEPSSGLDVYETERFGEILLETVRQDGIGILLVEHDMALVRSACDYIYVLDFGVMIFEGAADAALSSDLVKAAYLGTEAVA